MLRGSLPHWEQTMVAFALPRHSRVVVIETYGLQACNTHLFAKPRNIERRENICLPENVREVTF